MQMIRRAPRIDCIQRVIFDVLILGVLSGLRPATSTAAVVALLRAPDPRRTLLAFTVAGLLVSLAIGTVAVVAFGGVGRSVGGDRFEAVVYIVAGAASLGFAGAIARGHARLHHRHRTEGGRIANRLSNPSAVTAAVAGVATHVPGLLYLVALNAIAAEQLGAARSTFQIALYNALWFMLPASALVLAIASPGTAQRYLSNATDWARRNEDRLVLVLFGALGGYLFLKGVWKLATG